LIPLSSVGERPISTADVVPEVLVPLFFWANYIIIFKIEMRTCLKENGKIEFASKISDVFFISPWVITHRKARVLMSVKQK